MRRRWFALSPRLAGLGLVILLVSSAAQAGITKTERKDPALVPPAADGRLPLLVETHNRALIAARVEALGGRVTYVFENLDALAVLLPPHQVDALLKSEGVNNVVRQRLVHRAVVAPHFPVSSRLSMPREMQGKEFVPLPGGMAERRIETIPVSELPQHVRGSGTSSFLGYDVLTGAAQSWEAAGYGEGTIVAVLDTGIYPDHPLITGSVIGGENFVPAEEEQAIDHDEDGNADGLSFDWDAIENNSHGTFVSGLIAGHADLILAEDDPLAVSVAFHSPESIELTGTGTANLHLMGTAPGADLYAIKVFPYDGGGAPDARIAEAIDHLITMKRNAELDTDVINMSLSGPVLYDGWNPLDLIVNVATANGITSVAAASNEGPALTTVGSPGSAMTAVTAGGAIDPLHIRVAAEVLFGLDAGLGTFAYPEDRIQVVDFSSRGLTGDGRVKPDLIASALLVFSSTIADENEDGLGDTPSFGFSAGTSFSTPTIAGSAALVHAFAETKGQFASAPYVGNALVKAATPIADYEITSQREQGRGFVHIPAAFDNVTAGDVWNAGFPEPEHRAMAEISIHGGTGHGETPDLAAGETFNFLIQVPEGLASLIFDVSGVHFSGGEQNPFLGDNLAVTIHSAKRGGAGDYIYGEELQEPVHGIVYRNPEPGTMRVTLMGSFANYGNVSGAIEVRANFNQLVPDQVFEGVLTRDEVAEHSINIPEHIPGLLVALSWHHDWTMWPTFDLDLFAENSAGEVAAATIDSPELLFVDNPVSGKWTFHVADIGTVLRSEPYTLAVKFLHTPADHEEREFDGDPPPAILGIQPNPFAPQTEIRFDVPSPERMEIKVFDVAGRLVRTLASG
ncbi:MAG TPA: S8 family serine peptidase, partial [bacterium]|nr:S8 family serine peptidase [bacterium]